MCIIRSMLALLGPLDLYLSYYRKGFQEEQSKSRLQPAVLMGVTPSSIPIISFPPICHQYSCMRLVLVCQAFERQEFFSQPSLQYAILSWGALSFQASLCSGSTPSIIHKICLSLLGRKASLCFHLPKIPLESREAQSRTSNFHRSAFEKQRSGVRLEACGPVCSSASFFTSLHYSLPFLLALT